MSVFAPTGLGWHLEKMGLTMDAYGGGRFSGNLAARNLVLPKGNVWYVDAGVSASKSGKSWNTAFKTIQEAINAHNALIDWSDWVDNFSVIVVAPGLYAEALTPAYNAAIIGLGSRSADAMAEIHPTTGAALAGTALGLQLINLWLESEDADVLDFGTVHGLHIKDCVLRVGDSQAGTKSFIDVSGSMKEASIINTHFSSGAGTMAFGINCPVGCTYFHNTLIEHCIIDGIKSAGTGIYVDGSTVTTGTVIRDNVIRITGAGKGIDDNNGACLCVNNHISVSVAGTAIETANQFMTVGNHTVVANTGAIVDSGS